MAADIQGSTAIYDIQQQLVKNLAIKHVQTMNIS
jgi:hypothetical protein